MSRRTFDKLVNKLEQNLIFRSTGKRPQRAVRYQLATFLMRYGTLGSDIMPVANKMGIGTGTVHNYCRRVTRALRQLGVTVVTWGTDAQHQATAEFFREHSGLEDCIGIVDGSLICLVDVPGMWALSCFCRKKFPCVRCQYLLQGLLRAQLLPD